MSGKFNSNTSTMSSQQLGTLDSLVYDYFRYAIEAILKDRKAKLIPIISASQLLVPPQQNMNQVDQSGYISNTLHAWKKSLTKPLTLDLYLYHPKLQTHILIERWNFVYQANNDFSNKKSDSSSSSRLLAIINRRVQTLLRSLYCFVRLLPGFNLLPLSSFEPMIHFQLYDARMNPTSFLYESSKHTFPVIATAKGKIATSVFFVTSIHVKEILKNMNDGLLFGGLLPEESQTESTSKAVAIPIPIQKTDNSPYSSERHRPHADPKEHYRKSFQAKEGDLQEFQRGAIYARSLDSNLPPDAFVRQHNTMSNNLNPAPNHRQQDPIAAITGQHKNRSEMPILGSTPPIVSSLQSTPPFAMPALPQDEGYSVAHSFDFRGPSPPYPQPSSSLQSSPGSNPLALMDRRNSFRKSFTKGSMINDSVYEKLRSKITLPISPFILSSSPNSVHSLSFHPQLGITNANLNLNMNPPSENNSNKLDIVIQFERDRERRMSDIFADMTDRSRSLSGITRDSEIDKLSDYFDSAAFAIPQEDDLPFALPPMNTTDLGSSLLHITNKYRNPVNGPSMNESNTYYSLTALAGELKYKLNEFKEFRSQLNQKEDR